MTNKDFPPGTRVRVESGGYPVSIGTIVDPNNLPAPLKRNGKISTIIKNEHLLILLDNIPKECNFWNNPYMTTGLVGITKIEDIVSTTHYNLCPHCSITGEYVNGANRCPECWATWY